MGPSRLSSTSHLSLGLDSVTGGFVGHFSLWAVGLIFRATVKKAKTATSLARWVK